MEYKGCLRDAGELKMSVFKPNVNPSEGLACPASPLMAAPTDDSEGNTSLGSEAFLLTLNNLCVLFTDPLGGRLLPVYPRCNLESVPKKVGESKEWERHRARGLGKLAATRASRERRQLSVTGSSPHEGRESLGCFPLTFHGFAALEDCFLLVSPLSF